MVKKNIFCLLFFCLSLLSFGATAKEPVNLAVVKQGLIRYHDSGEYMFDIDNVIKQALRYLKLRLDHPDYNGKKPLIILDVDETSLSNYANIAALGFGGTLEEIRHAEDEASDPAITPTLQLYRFAKEHNIPVIFLSGRFEYERQATIKNLLQVGYSDWNGLILRSDQYKTAPASVYKTAMRKQLTEQGYDIILNIGDQKSDLVGHYADKIFKLPDPFYLIP